MPIVVYFTKNNTRIIQNPENLEEWKSRPRAVIDPDLSEVRGIAPHFWKLEDGKIVRMTGKEQAAVLHHHELHGVDNEIPSHDTVSAPDWMRKQNRKHRIRLGLALAAGGGFVQLAHLIAHHL